jgi:hypothetical protein
MKTLLKLAVFALSILAFAQAEALTCPANMIKVPTTNGYECVPEGGSWGCNTAYCN